MLETTKQSNFWCNIGKTTQDLQMEKIQQPVDRPPESFKKKQMSTAAEFAIVICKKIYHLSRAHGNKNVYIIYIYI